MLLILGLWTACRSLFCVIWLLLLSFLTASFSHASADFFACQQAGSQDQEHRILSCNLPLDRADPLHLCARHGDLRSIFIFFAGPHLFHCLYLFWSLCMNFWNYWRAGGLCSHPVASWSACDWVFHSMVHSGDLSFIFLEFCLRCLCTDATVLTGSRASECLLWLPWPWRGSWQEEEPLMRRNLCRVESCCILPSSLL